MKLSKADIRYIARGRAQSKYVWPLAGGLSVLVVVFVILINYNFCGPCVFISLFGAGMVWAMLIGLLIIRESKRQERIIEKEENNERPHS